MDIHCSLPNWALASGEGAKYAPHPLLRFQTLHRVYHCGFNSLKTYGQ